MGQHATQTEVYTLLGAVGSAGCFAAAVGGEECWELIRAIGCHTHTLRLQELQGTRNVQHLSTPTNAVSQKAEMSHLQAGWLAAFWQQVKLRVEQLQTSIQCPQVDA